MSNNFKYKTSFQDNWLANNEFSSWLEKIGRNTHCGKCRVCSKTVSLSGHGVKALVSHAKSVKHREQVFLKISQNSQENTCARVSFLVKKKA